MTIERRIETDPNVHAAMIDKHGNALIKFKDGRIEMKLATESKTRSIGIIKDKVLYVERNSERHIHRKSNSYGFNYTILKKSKTFDYVALLEDGEVTYMIPKDTINQYGKVLFFKNSADGNSFEVQIFLNRDIIKKYRK